MASKKYDTIEKIKNVKEVLETLPDLKKIRLTKDDVLENLKAQIVKLALNKGYVSKDIKSVLDSAGIKVTLKDIQKMISAKKSAKKFIKKILNKKLNNQKRINICLIFAFCFVLIKIFSNYQKVIYF